MKQKCPHNVGKEKKWYSRSIKLGKDPGKHFRLSSRTPEELYIQLLINSASDKIKVIFHYPFCRKTRISSVFHKQALSFNKNDQAQKETGPRDKSENKNRSTSDLDFQVSIVKINDYYGQENKFQVFQQILFFK